MEDLSAASMDDVQGFFRKYYVPNNAVLVLAGSFDEKQAKDWIEKYFGPIAKGADINRPHPAQPKLTGEIRKNIRGRGFRCPVYTWFGIRFRTLPLTEAALDMLGSILSQGRGSRLQSDLVYGKELVQNISARNGASEIAGMFQVSATAKRPDQSLDAIEKRVNAEIQKIQATPPTADEMSRALNSIEARTIFGLQTVSQKGSA